MALPVSEIWLSTSYISSPESVESDNELDITADYFHKLNLMTGAEGSTMAAKKDSPDQKEKQISVDPISLKESSRTGEASFNLMLPPMATAPELPPPVPPLKPQLISFSLPNSACSSPRFSFAVLKRKLKNESQASPRQIGGMPHRCIKPPPCHVSMQEIHQQRSKSCGEGRSRAPADDLDLHFNQPNSFEYHHDKNLSRTITRRYDHRTSKKMDAYNNDGFKCSALCLYLPGFGKAKPVRSRKEIIEVEAGIESVISRTVSLEKFECGSWASSAIVTEHDDGEDGSRNLFFDLPLELIRTSVNDATSPVAAAFVFDKDRRGVLRNNSTRKSHESTRHVRFSTSSPTSFPASPACSSTTNATGNITPRLCKAREDFGAFLEAHNA